MKRPDINAIERCQEAAYWRDDEAFIALADEHVPDLLAYIRHLEAANKLIEQETAVTCAYLAWQSQHISGAAHKYICREYGLNLDSLYSTTWKELNK